jgi:hypothetical protein
VSLLVRIHIGFYHCVAGDFVWGKQIFYLFTCACGTKFAFSIVDLTFTLFICLLVHVSVL